MFKNLISAVIRRNFFETGAVIGLRLFSIGVGFLFIKIYTNNLSTEEVGKYFYLVTLSYIMNALIFVPIDYYLQARLALHGKEIPVAALYKINKIVCLMAMLLCVIFCIPLLYLGQIHVVDIFGIYITALLVYLCNFSRGLLNNRGHKVFVVCMLVFEGLAKVGFFILSNSLMVATAGALLYSSVIALLLEVLIIFLYGARKIDYNWLDEGIENYKTVFRKSYALSIGAICNLVQLQSYRLMYVWAGVPVTAAIYVVITNLGSSGMGAISSVYSQIFLPRIYSSKGDFTLRYIRNALIVSLIVVIGAVLTGKYLLLFLTKNDYVEYAQAIGFGVLVEGGNLVIGAATVYLMLNSAAKATIVCNLLAALASVVGGYAVLHYWPENAFAIGIPIAISQIFIAAFLISYVIRFQKAKKKEVK
ncbi:lipopolysaccharide biosynthesis protein [Janthinobacterium sp. LB2P49]|uniref:lipopolysaccharide biosynthesis protein n=1 Tax=Janthinobacterium sp. LB2P49 TaxID=3424198 RepID=UPI003F2565EF